MSRTNDNALDQTPTTEVQGRRRDIGNDSPAIRGELSSGGTVASATNMELTPVQEAHALQALLREQQPLTNQQGLEASNGSGVNVINTPRNQPGLTYVQTVPVGRRQVSRTSPSFGTTATGDLRQDGMPNRSRANTRQPTNELGVQQQAFTGVGIDQQLQSMPGVSGADFVPSMEYNGGSEEEKRDHAFDDSEIVMNFGNPNVRRARRRSTSVDLPSVARSGIEDSAMRNQQLGGVMTQVGEIPPRQPASVTYQPRLGSKNTMERIAIGNDLSPVTGYTGDGSGSGGTYQDQGGSQRATPMTVEQQLQAESLRLKQEQVHLQKGVSTVAKHKYREELAKARLKQLSETALHLGGKSVANVGVERSTYNFAEWSSTIEQLATEMNILHRKEFLSTVKAVVHDMDGAHEGNRKMCQPNGRGLKDSGKNPHVHQFLRRWDAARNTQAVRNLKLKLDAAHHAQEAIPPEERTDEQLAKGVDYTPLFKLLVEVMSVYNKDAKTVDHHTLYNHDNALKLRSIKNDHCPTGTVIDRVKWEKMADSVRKNARTTTNHKGGQYTNPPEQVQLAQDAQALAKWALQRLNTTAMQDVLTEGGGTSGYVTGVVEP